MRALTRAIERKQYMGYAIGRAVALRDHWMSDARLAQAKKHSELVAACVRAARDRNRELVRALRDLARARS